MQRVTIEQYRGRKIKATRAKRDGFRVIRTEVNDVPVWTYPTDDLDSVLLQTRRDIEAVDADPGPSYEAHMYAANDPRRAARLKQLEH